MTTYHREWGFHVEDQSHVNHLMTLIKRYNLTKTASKHLVADRILRHTVNDVDRYYLSVVCSDNSYTPSIFIENNYVGTVYYPYEKPSWWGTEPEAVVWSRESSPVPCLS